MEAMNSEKTCKKVRKQRPNLRSKERKLNII